MRPEFQYQLRTTLLKLIAAGAVFCPLYLAMPAVCYFFEQPANLLFCSVVFAVCFVGSSILVNFSWLGRLFGLLLFLPVFVLAIVTAPAGFNTALFHVFWASVFSICAIRAGRLPYDGILTTSTVVFSIILFLLTGFLDYFLHTGLSALLPLPICLFVFGLLLTSNQAGLDTLLGNRKRVNSAIPQSLRRRNIVMVTLVSLLLGGLFLLREYIGPLVSNVLWLAGAVIGYIIGAIFWLFNLLAFDDTGSVTQTPELSRPEMVETSPPSPLWEILAALVLVFVVGYLLYKLLPKIWPGLKLLWYKLSSLIAELLASRTRAVTDEAAFSDTVEEIEPDTEKSRRKLFRSRSPRLSELDKMPGTAEKLRFLMRLSRLTLTPVFGVKPSDTTGLALRKAGQDPQLAELTDLYEKVRYGGYTPLPEEADAARRQYTSWKESIPHERKQNAVKRSTQWKS